MNRCHLSIRVTREAKKFKTRKGEDMAGANAFIVDETHMTRIGVLAFGELIEPMVKQFTKDSEWEIEARLIGVSKSNNPVKFAPVPTVALTAILEKAKGKRERKQAALEPEPSFGFAPPEIDETEEP
jgi:hypothetical protein